MRVYDKSLGRFLSVDPITRQYPELTPYQFASNCPIGMIDLDGLEGVKPKYKLFDIIKVMNSVAINQRFIEHKKSTLGQKITPRDIAYITSYEQLTTTMYDQDGSKKYPGNATIGFGTLIHYGLIGSTAHDPDALKKEVAHLNGISIDQAANLFLDELFEKEGRVNRYIKQLGLEGLINDDQFFALVDLAFNKGQAYSLEVLKVFKQKGNAAAAEYIKNLPNDNNKGLKKRRYFESTVFSSGRRLLEDAAAKELETGKLQPSNTLPQSNSCTYEGFKGVINIKPFTQDQSHRHQDPVVVPPLNFNFPGIH
jgi:GH24 family phage-related lysozyme (muramidase)